jgi:hypothetical protein
MKKQVSVMGILASFLVLSFCSAAAAQSIHSEDCFFLKSLHYTARGMEYWYSKENGGLESLTGVPYEDLACKRCHTAGCDRCHRVKTGKKGCETYKYSTKAAASQNMCLECHGREKAMIRINHKAEKEDVHLLQGMVCADCHSEREMHGDGREFVSLKEKGAMDTQCENCHPQVKPTEAHTSHGGKLDCKACHLRHVVSCTNCHFDTMVEKGKRRAIPVSGWLFLLNHDGKVTSASMQTFVTQGNKTFLMFAPHMSHSVMAEGRPCESCHGTENMEAAQKGEITLTWLEDGAVQNLKGVIPVVDNVDYKCVYQNLEDGKWVPIENPMKPLRQYAAFGEPLTPVQLEKLQKEQHPPPHEIAE